MTTDRILLVSLSAIALAAWTFVGSALWASGPPKELVQAREKAAINLCVDNGGQAQFRYDQGADHLVFIGCTFSRGQERP